MLKLFKSNRCQSCYNERAMRQCPRKKKIFAGNVVMKQDVIPTVQIVVPILLKEMPVILFLHSKLIQELKQKM